MGTWSAGGPSGGGGSSGAVWNSGGAQSAPVQTDILRAAASPAPADGGGCGFDWGQIRYGEWSSDDPNLGIPQDGNFVGSPSVWTPQVRSGYFWVILGLSLSYNDANTRTFAQFLVPPAFAIRPDEGSIVNPTTFLFNSLGAGKAFDAIPKFGVRIQGAFGALQSPGMHASLLTPGMLIVPAGWAILTCRDDTQIGSAQKATVRVQAAYAELPIGSDSPGFGG
jgi:hypothetical protein